MKQLYIGFGIISLLIPQCCLGGPIDDEIHNIINDTLNELERFIPNTNATKELLKLTAAVESDNGRNIAENESTGVFQLEKKTIKNLQNKINTAKNEDFNLVIEQLKKYSIIHYHAALAALYYDLRINLPNLKISENPNNIEVFTLAMIWKNEYNTWLGRGNPFQAYQKYKLYTGRD